VTPRDCDPLRAPGTDDIFPSAEYVEGYDAGWTDADRARPGLLHATAFGVGLIVGMLAAVVLMISSTVHQ
jgi:hypothetical protein